MVKAVGGLYGGNVKGPYTVPQLRKYYEQYKDRLGGFFVKSVEIYRGGKLFFRLPADGGIREFLAKDKRATVISPPIIKKPAAEILTKIPGVTVLPEMEVITPQPPMDMPPMDVSPPMEMDAMDVSSMQLPSVKNSVIVV